MELVLWRHADAESGIPDEARRLTPKGVVQAERMAIWLKEKLPPQVQVLASPAQRAQQTAQALTADFRVCNELGTITDPQSLLKAAGWPHGEGTVVLVGHQPTLGAAVALVLTGNAAAWSFRKGAVWWLAQHGQDGEAFVRVAIAPDML